MCVCVCVCVCVTVYLLMCVAKGKVERMKKFKINVEDPPRRKHMVFLGGSVLADIMKDRAEVRPATVTSTLHMGLACCCCHELLFY